VRAARPTGTIDGFLHSLDGKVKLKKPLSIEDIFRIAAAGWAGNLDQE
jgi:antitoxin PrlF